MFDAPEIKWETIGVSSRVGTILDKVFYQRLNRELRNLFDEMSGRYGIRILGFGKRDWEHGYDMVSSYFGPKQLTLQEVLGTE